jgi:hypothetical protein
VNGRDVEIKRGGTHISVRGDDVTINGVVMTTNGGEPGPDFPWDR